MLTSISLGSPENLSLYSFLFTIAAFTVVIILEITEHMKDRKEKKENEKKEAERQKFLSEIYDSISATNYPITPFRLFFTLKHTVNEEILDKYFEGINGYKSLKPNKYLKLVSSMSLSDIPYNSEDESPQRSHCRVDGNIVAELRNELRENVAILKLPTKINVEIYTANSESTPEIIFESNYRATEYPDSIREIRLYDDWLYQDTKITDWKIKTSMQRAYGLRDFKNCKIKVVADFFINDRKYDDTLPRFTNLHLFFGSLPINLIYFKKQDLLENQKSFRRNPLDGIMKLEGELANEYFQTLALEFNFNITKDYFMEHTVQFNQ